MSKNNTGTHTKQESKSNHTVDVITTHYVEVLNNLLNSGLNFGLITSLKQLDHNLYKQGLKIDIKIGVRKI